MKRARPKFLFQGKFPLALFCGFVINVLTLTHAFAEASNDTRILFLGNKNIAPVVYLDGTTPSGVAVDIVRALAKHIPQPIEIKAMDWSEAQALVARGQADALIQINTTEERKKIYDFSEPLLESHFSIFTRADKMGISGLSSLQGLSVGVESGGLPQKLLKKDPQIDLTIIPNFLEGFKLLNDGSVAAVVVDYWVGSYILAENDIRNIKVTGEPIQSSYSSIAVKKGNTKLLYEINKALQIIKNDGTYQKIIDNWKPKEGVFQTQEQITERMYAVTILILLILFLISMIWMLTLKKELAKRKVAEEKLREQYSTLRSIINSANALIFSVDRQYRYTSFNMRHAAVMQAIYGAELNLSHSMLEYMTVLEDRETARRNLDRALGGEQLVEEAYSGDELRSRQYFQVSHSPIKTETGEIIGVAVLAQDLTEHRRAEEDIAWNLAINQALSSLYIPIVTAGTNIEQIANIVLERCRQLTGSTHGFVAEIDPATGDLIAHTLTKMMQTECTVAEEELRTIRFSRRPDGLYGGLWGHALNTKEPFSTDEPVKHPASVGIPEGHIALERFLTVPVLLAGKLVGQIALSNSTRAYKDRDLHAVNRMAEFFALAIQHKRAEEKIHRLNQELEQRVLERTAKLEATNKELEAFAYSVSHDLRAPLRHIDGFLALLQKKTGTALDEQGRHHIETIAGAAQKMGQLIDDLLSFSRMGRHAMSFQPVALEALVRDVIRELEPDAAGRDIDWRIGDLPTVGGDAAMLRLVLANLISNALKFTRSRQEARIEIGSLPGQTAEAVIFVSDNGVGFDMAYVDKLFGVFQRLHRDDEFEGTGIGLASVRRIIARHGGRTWAEGQIGQGAVFYFSLPRSVQGA